MNSKKALGIVNFFRDRAIYYQRFFKTNDPSVEQLRDMKKEYVDIGIRLNRAIEEPEVQRENAEDLVNAARKSNVNRTDLRLDDMVTPYSSWNKIKDFALAGCITAILGLTAYTAKLGYDFHNLNIENRVASHVAFLNEMEKMKEEHREIVTFEIPELPKPEIKPVVQFVEPKPVPVPIPVYKPEPEPVKPKENPQILKAEKAYATALTQLQQAELRLEQVEDNAPRLKRSIKYAAKDLASGLTFGVVDTYDEPKPRGWKRISHFLNCTVRGALMIPMGIGNTALSPFENREKEVRQRKQQVRQLEIQLYTLRGKYNGRIQK
tara:strand:- start:146 stop:1111 length:966 start_codon:yes stop_codon:yes gene_type:complete